MDVRNRIADVVALRCKVCQDFIVMILKDGWQDELYQKAENEVNNSTRFKDKYKPVYERMRDKGIESYQVEDMDVTIINELVKAGYVGRFNSIERVDKATWDLLKGLSFDRNVTNHSSENEDPEELYLRGLIDLIRLRDFVRIVDEKETYIDNNQRLAYRRKYTDAIEQLKTLLDDERIELIQTEKNIRKDIQRILDSDDPDKMWFNIASFYSDRALRVDKNFDSLDMFMMMASDAGLVRAHSEVASIYLYQKEYGKFEDMLLTILQSSEEITFRNAYDVIRLINEYRSLENELTAGMVRMLDEIDRSGNPVFLMECEEYSYSYYTLPQVEFDMKTRKCIYKPMKGGIPWSEISSYKDK